MQDDRLFETTTLWTRTLTIRKGDSASRQRERLRASYEALRRNTAALVAQIQSDLRSITLHDINHLDMLWQSADLIAGPNFFPNPAEAFVFGGAVLLHDAGL